MKWLTNNFSLNMVCAKEDYILAVKFISERQFKIETKSAINRLSKMATCQELGLLPHKGNVQAEIGDSIYTAQKLDGELIYRKIEIKGGNTQC